MKFSFRVVSISLFLVSLVVMLVYWDTDWFNSRELKYKKGSTSSSHRTHRFTFHKTTPATTFKKTEECTFSLSKGGYSDIDTYNILHQKVDQPQKQEQDGRHLMPRAPPPGSNDVKDYVPKSGNLPLKIILVPHSHNDPGWHKTVEGYFEDQTKPTLDNMIEKMEKFPNMTFVWAESVFLHMWYQDLSPAEQLKVKRLIKRKQLEVVVGSWVVPDEANPHYFAMVDQMIEGHQWLERTMGVKPKSTWTLDPFGYSSTLPYLYKRAGYENMVILRVHEQLKESLQNDKALEFYWRQHWDNRHDTDIFTLMMPYKLYNIKHTCGPDHYICLQFDFRKIPGEYSEARADPITDQNVDRQAKLLLGQYQKKANLYRHNVVLIPLGDDFRYDRNIEWDQQYKNYMKLFTYINRKKEWNVQARFGTLQDYFEEVKKTVAMNPELEEQSFPSLQGDFFPYTDEHSDYWTGYFTTRPFDKNMGREVEVHLRAAEIANTIALATSIQRGIPFKEYAKNMEHLPQARQNLGLFQHHDAITGTARSYVVMDYEQRLHSALDIAQSVIGRSIAYLMSATKPKDPVLELDIDQAKSLRILHPTKKSIVFSENGKSELILFNSIAQDREELVRVTVPIDRIEVYDEKGKIVTSQINPIFTSNTDISTKHFELAFFAKLPPLGTVKYNLIAVQDTSKPKENYAAYVRMYNADGFREPSNVRFNIMPPGGEHITLENEAFRARFSTRSGMMHSITTKNKIVTTQVNMEYLMYKSRGSGAYIFNPTGPAVDTEMSTRPVLRVIKGPVYSEIQMVQELVEGTVRLCNTTGLQGHALMIENIADLRTKENKELIMRLSTDIKHNATFYTDLNAFHMMKRKRFNHLPPEANYYPTSAFAYIEDDEKRLSLISAQPLGVSSQEEGMLEIMLERRLQWDDGRGLGEGVMDNKRAPSRFYLIIEPKDIRAPEPHLPMPSLVSHQLANTLRNHVFVLIPPITMLNSSLPSFQPLSQPLPCDLELMNYRSIDIENSNNVPSAALLLHRVGYQCQFQMLDSSCPSTNGQLNLSKLFSGAVQINDVWETTISLMHNKSSVGEPNQNLKLLPMEIHAFKTTFN